MTSTLQPAPTAAPRRTTGLVLAGSLRQASLSRAVAEALAGAQPWLRLGPSLDRLPFYDADVDALATPAAVTDLRDRVRESDLVVWVTPDQHGTVPGLVTNAVDWLARPVRRSALLRSRFLVVGVSDDAEGGLEGAARLAERLERAGAVPLAEPVAVAHAGQLVVADGVADVSGVAALHDLHGRVRRAPAVPSRRRRAAA